MAEILTCRRGLVIPMRIACRGGIPAKIKFDPTFEPTAALISSISWNQSVNVQFQPTLGGPVYVYVFGDLMGNVTISGVAFAGTCDDRSQTGIQEVFDYYNSNRASQRSEAVIVTYGPESSEGFLTRLALRPTDPERMTAQFQMTIRTLPKEE
jgi:hypothetical protein